MNKIFELDIIRIKFEDKFYPQKIKNIMGKKSPRHLDLIGNIQLLNMNGIGICGSRKSTLKGLSIAKDCAEQAAKNDISIISGNAAGVDMESHFNCLKAGGRTILVLAEGINHFKIKKSLKPVWDWERILVISQFESDDPWKVFRAMARNQIIIALSKIMILIEATEKGGTFNAGKETLKVGHPLFVAVYNDMSIDGKGNQILLNMGANKLSKNRTTNKANLTKIFKIIKEDYCVQNNISNQKTFSF